MRVLKVRVRILGRRPCLAAFAALFMGGLGSVVGPMQARSHTFWTLSNVGPVLPGPTRSWLAVRRHPAVLDGVARIWPALGLQCVCSAWSFCWPFSSSSPSLVSSSHCPCSPRLSPCRRREVRARACLGHSQGVVILLLAEDRACQMVGVEGGLLVEVRWLAVGLS